MFASDSGMPFLKSFMKNTDTEVTQTFEETQALLKGHFILRSGLRSEFFFQYEVSLSALEKSYSTGTTND